MCFSAAASFTSAIVLTGAGITTLSRVQQLRQLPLAMVPLIFAIQQASEGLVWIGLRQATTPFYLHPASYLFLIFAQVVWPIWVPMSFLLLAPREKNRIELMILTWTGLLVATYLGICLFHYGTFAEAHTRHIYYALHYPAHLTVIAAALYGAVTIVPPFVSGVRHGWVLGLAILISYVITSILYTQEIVSTWCFFSALMSVIIYAILVKHREPGLIGLPRMQLA